MEHDSTLLGEELAMTASINVWPPTEVWEARAKARTKFVEEYIPKHGLGAELGVYRGDFTRILLDVAQPQMLHLIDPWYLLGQNWERFGVWGPTTSKALDTVKARYVKEIAADRVYLHVADDLKLLPEFPDGYFDWVYVDSLHERHHCAAELNLLKTKVTGVIAGDDWVSDPAHPSHGVCVAVREFIRSEPYELIYASDDDAQWAILRSSS